MGWFPIAVLSLIAGAESLRPFPIPAGAPLPIYFKVEMRVEVHAAKLSVPFQAYFKTVRYLSSHLIVNEFRYRGPQGTGGLHRIFERYTKTDDRWYEEYNDAKDVWHKTSAEVVTEGSVLKSIRVRGRPIAEGRTEDGYNKYSAGHIDGTTVVHDQKGQPVFDITITGSEIKKRDYEKGVQLLER